MKLGQMLLSNLLVLGLASPSIAVVDVASNPYRQAIVDRNVFGLKSPPPPPPPESLKPPPSKLILVGIVNVFGTKKAVIKSSEPPKPAAPGQTPVAEDPYVIMEGNRDHDVEVIEIDEKTGSVKVINSGQPETLTFEKNGAKLPSGPSVPAPGTTPTGPAGGGIPKPGGLIRPGMPGMPSGIPGAVGGQGVGVGGMAGSAGTVSSLGMPGVDSSIPTRPVRTDGTQMTPEQNAIIYEANRLRNEELTKAGLIPRLPTHPLIKRMDDESKNLPQPTQ